ncbi:hypothetical protein E4T56_gene9134, partial [Termitomyces sp. T112]
MLRDHDARLRHGLGSGKVDLGQQHHVGAGELILEDFSQRDFVFDARIGKALRLQRGQIGRETPRRHRPGIGQRQHAIDRDPAADGGPRQQPFDRGNEIIGHRAADAAIGQFDDIFRRAIRYGAGLQNIAIHPQRAEFIDHHGQPAPPGMADQMADQRGLSGAKKAGDDGNGHFRQIGTRYGHGQTSCAPERDRAGLAGKSGRHADAGRTRQAPDYPRDRAAPAAQFRRSDGTIDGKTDRPAGHEKANDRKAQIVEIPAKTGHQPPWPSRQAEPVADQGKRFDPPDHYRHDG